MKTRGGGIVGYNLQTAVDAEHHLIVAHEVVTEGSDRDQLAMMAEHAREATGIEELTVVADRGYFKGEQSLQCEQIGITAIVPKTLTSNSLADGRFDKQDFIYIAADDEFRCPANERAIKRFTTLERLDRRPEMMRVRRQTVEHPFGTIKHWMGSSHFLTRTLPRVRAEMSLHVHAYNFKRVMRIVGTERMLQIMRA